ncbi:MAG: methyltransferase domain-containing protein [Gammaproteobacteria bacterium]|nr:methyltransferase domain-containing protein [Gammaproteobacteria bacterium]
MPIVTAERIYSEGMIDQARSEYNFLALNVLFSQLQANKKYNILDMGPANGMNLDFFSNFRCKIFIEDLYQSRQEYVDSIAGPGKTFNIVDVLLKYDSDVRFDVILFWDLFDYLEVEELKTLIKHISKFCSKGSMMFFITSGMDNIPQEPAVFRILDKQHLQYENHSPTNRRGHGYRQSMYKNLLPGFKLYRGFRMSTGMEENLFIYTGKS